MTSSICCSSASSKAPSSLQSQYAAMSTDGTTSEDASSVLPSFDPDEMFDVCNAENKVIGQERRAEVHAKGLFHRSVQVSACGVVIT